ncbi:hypothetical protein DYB25_009898 [Aphanomyces astaci]|uniref:BED-type domain-containing protein n=1 Tax=Aphanomyces astaci TaxID=112090 RepID=A0A397AKX3_APHAT|nr:hypothetical protein DYB25_009898 [Aphanomyces astaci]
MPRPPDSVWAHFRRDDTQRRAICKFCHHNMVGLVNRMRVHLGKRCPDCPPSVRLEMLSMDSDGAKKAAVMANGGGGATFLASLDPTSSYKLHSSSTMMNDSAKSKKRKGVFPEHGNSVLSPLDKQDVQSLVARAIFGAGLAVSVIEDPSFARLIQRVAPSIPLSTSLTLTQLDAEFHDLQAQVLSDLNDMASVCVGIESWSFLHNRSVLSCMVYTPHPAMFCLDATREYAHTTTTLFQRMESFVLSIGLDKVSTVVSDVVTSPNMKDATDLLLTKYPHLTVLPSCAHAFDAMMTELLELPVFHSLYTVCTRVSAYFSRNHLHKARFARVAHELNIEDPANATQHAAAASGTTTATTSSSCFFGLVDIPDGHSKPPPTSILACLWAMERYRHVFDVLLAEDFGALDSLDLSLRDQLSNLAWWSSVVQFKTMFAPFVDVLETLESGDFTSLATFYHKFTLLWTHLQSFPVQLSPDVTRIVSKHWATMRHPAMYTAYLLDPRFSPSSLGNEEMNEALTFLKHLSSPALFANLISELTRYTGRCAGVFADDAVWESAKQGSPLQWWKGFLGSSCPHLQTVALRVLCFPASAGISRAKRAKVDAMQIANDKILNEDQAMKAAYVYLNLNLSTTASDDLGANGANKLGTSNGASLCI